MPDLINSVKILSHISKILFPKYPCYYFTCYMFLNYTKIHLKQKNFKIVVCPDQFLKSLLCQFSIENSIDASNCVVVKGSKFCNNFALLCKHGDSKTKPRLVQIFTIDSNEIQNDEVTVSSTLNFNLKNVNKLTKTVHIRFVKLSEALLASEIDVSQVNIFCDIPSDVIDSILKQYFATPRLLYSNDIITINIKEYAAQHYFMNKQVNSVEAVYFKCNNVVSDKKVNNFYGCFVCVADHSSLKLSANVQSFLPKITEYSVESDAGVKKIDICPYGLTDYFLNLKASIKPFLFKSNNFFK